MSIHAHGYRAAESGGRRVEFAAVCRMARERAQRFRVHIRYFLSSCSLRAFMPPRRG